MGVSLRFRWGIDLTRGRLIAPTWNPGGRSLKVPRAPPLQRAAAAPATKRVHPIPSAVAHAPRRAATSPAAAVNGLAGARARAPGLSSLRGWSPTRPAKPGVRHAPRERCPPPCPVTAQEARQHSRRCSSSRARKRLTPRNTRPKRPGVARWMPRHRTESAPNFAERGPQFRPDFGTCGAEIGLGEDWPGIGRTCAGVGRMWTSFDRCWADFVKFGNFGLIGADSATLGRIWAMPTQSCADDEIWASRKHLRGGAPRSCCSWLRSGRVPHNMARRTRSEGSRRHRGWGVGFKVDDLFGDGRGHQEHCRGRLPLLTTTFDSEARTRPPRPALPDQPNSAPNWWIRPQIGRDRPSLAEIGMGAAQISLMPDQVWPNLAKMGRGRPQDWPNSGKFGRERKMFTEIGPNAETRPCASQQKRWPSASMGPHTSMGPQASEMDGMRCNWRRGARLRAASSLHRLIKRHVLKTPRLMLEGRFWNAHNNGLKRIALRSQLFLQ